MVQNSLQGNDCRAWMVDPDRACNIDEPLDLLVAELLLKHHGLLVQP
jgi:CMP-N-acetylneuraminic acid synthetase